jgi:putative transposase
MLTSLVGGAILIDLRKRILKAYDQGGVTQQDMANRFDVSYGMVKKLIQQRRRIDDFSSQHHRSGKKPEILDSHCLDMKRLIRETSDLTLEELRVALGLDCTIQAIHYALADNGLTIKKDTPS